MVGVACREFRDLLRSAVRFHPTSVLAITIIALCCGFGCASPRVMPMSQQSHVIFLPGIGGDDLLIRRAANLMQRRMPATSAQVWDWTSIEPRLSWLNLANLQDRPRNQRRAAELARQLVEWRKQRPEARLYLIGFSGGTAIAAWACDSLPEDFALERVVFLASGLSPQADLRAALRKARNGVVSFHSENDNMMLRDFTTRNGTMDRQYGPAAGRMGFRVPTDPQLQMKFVQKAWTTRMRRLGHDGGHAGSLATAFLEEEVIPLLSEASNKLDNPGIASRISRSLSIGIRHE